MSTTAFKSHSPLDSLVRRTSARRTHNAGYPQLSPASPLLHGHFARDSVATTSSSGDNSYLNSTRSSVDSRIVDQELDHRFCDDESIYSDSYPSFSSVPTLIVSSPNDSTEATEHSRAGRMPIMGPTGLNFSRPVRPPLSSTPEDEQQKRRVLERNRPPSLRIGSPVSLYSGYSFYQFDSETPSPTGEFHDRLQTRSTSGQVTQSSPTQQLSFTDVSLPSDTPTPQDYLQQGIQHHEANRLKESAICFEKSAKNNGGCGIGMLMWGLALRHGWGCEKNEKFAFKWLTRAAESAVEDLENARAGGGIDSSAVQTELVLAIYEVGQCFFQGWGVAKDQKMAVSYYTVAARLGDSDAQSDLAFCLANGKGCRKDRREAAKWYRAAVAQGQSDIGLAWIYKEKYQ
ncbi:HCP-like protein [Tricholoma matsutake]|nr:HCP-like protein [Tricholoma matsutake 945]